MAEIVLEAAIAGTGYGNAAITRPMTPDGAIELIVSRGEIKIDARMPRLSRSLLRSASQGLPVQMLGSGGVASGSPGHTTNIAALCGRELVASRGDVVRYLVEHVLVRIEIGITRTVECAGRGVNQQLRAFGGPHDGPQVSGVDPNDRYLAFLSQETPGALGVSIAASDLVALAGEKLGQVAPGGARSQNENAHRWETLP